jgi:hypothetical protein
METFDDQAELEYFCHTHTHTQHSQMHRQPLSLVSVSALLKGHFQYRRDYSRELVPAHTIGSLVACTLHTCSLVHVQGLIIDFNMLL